MLVDADKKQYSKDNHIKYKQLVARKGTYFSRKFAVECEKIGRSATPVISQNAADRKKFSGRYTFAPEEKFIEPKPVNDSIVYEIIADPFQIVQMEAFMRENGITFVRIR